MIPETGHKYQEAVESLDTEIKGMVDRDAVFGFAKGNKIPIRDRLLCLAAVATAYFRLSRVWKSVRLRPYAQVLVLLMVFRFILERKEKTGRYWVIVGDLTTGLIALSVAAKETGHKLLYWQYSLLDFKRMPVAADYAVVLNERGQTLSRIADKNRIFWRREFAIKPLRLKGAEEGPLGVFLNVHANENSIARLARLAKALGMAVHVRLHPNSRLDPKCWPKELIYAPTSESLEAFSERISLAICGNTQAQVKTLANGTPVVQFAGLDILEFDHHEYVRKGIIPGFERVKSFSIDKVIEFYRDPVSRRALEKYLNVPEAKSYRPFSELVEALEREFTLKRIA